MYARCSRVKLDDSTPPNNSASLTVPSVERFEVDFCITYQLVFSKYKNGSHFEGEVFQIMGYTGLRLIPASGFDEESD